MELFEEEITIERLIFIVQRKEHILQNIIKFKHECTFQGIKNKFYIDKLKIELKELQKEYNKSIIQLNSILEDLNTINNSIDNSIKNYI